MPQPTPKSTTGTLTPEQMQADIAFLLLRSGSAGSCSFTNDRWTGMSSNALVVLAYGGEQTKMPSDRSDYAACVRTYVRLPKHRKTDAVRAGLIRAREAYLAHYPEERTAAGRRRLREAWEAERRSRQPTRRRSHA